jgi:hypothetical protein
MRLQNRHDTGVSNRWRYCYAGARLVFILLSAGISLADSTATNPRSQMSIQLTEADSGSTVDMAVGASLNIFLDVPSEDAYKSGCYWSKITSSDASILEEVRKAVLLRAGVTAAFFQAVQGGVVELESLRQNCSGGGLMRWHVTVRVTKST